MANRDIVVVGGSAGGIEPMGTLLSLIPKDIPAAIFFVLHVPSTRNSLLPEILSRSGFEVRQPVDGEPIRHGQVRVAPPDRHMLLERERVRVLFGPRHNRHRPAIDPLFRTATREFGARVIGVILSGSLDDGTAGLYAIKRRGGLAFVQDPQTAVMSSMPQSAIEQVAVDFVGPVRDLARQIVKHVNDRVPDDPPAPDRRLEEEIRAHLGVRADMDALGMPSVFTCPECHGTLWIADASGPPMFQCRVGHGYTAASLLSDHEASVETALWSAARALDENISMRRHIAERMREINDERSAETIEETTREAEAHAQKLREILRSRGPQPDLDAEAS
jgi:two-component system, chemotaxis family, protein-glutamate methylesterase/glutaminase